MRLQAASVIIIVRTCVLGACTVFQVLQRYDVSMARVADADSEWLIVAGNNGGMIIKQRRAASRRSLPFRRPCDGDDRPTGWLADWQPRDLIIGRGNTARRRGLLHVWPITDCTNDCLVLRGIQRLSCDMGDVGYRRSCTIKGGNVKQGRPSCTAYVSHTHLLNTRSASQAREG